MGGSLRHSDDEIRTRKIGSALHGKLARRLRNEPTASERRFWVWLRTFRKVHGFHFRRQLPIGRFVADFGCHAARLIIELDGPFHDPERDRDRDAWFAKAGYRTLRFPNQMVVGHWDRVVAEIEHALGVGRRLDGPLTHLQQPPTPRPPPLEGEGESARPPHEGEGRGAGDRPR